MPNAQKNCFDEDNVRRGDGLVNLRDVDDVRWLRGRPPEVDAPRRFLAKLEFGVERCWVGVAAKDADWVTLGLPPSKRECGVSLGAPRRGSTASISEALQIAYHQNEAGRLARTNCARAGSSIVRHIRSAAPFWLGLYGAHVVMAL